MGIIVLYKNKTICRVKMMLQKSQNKQKQTTTIV